MHCPAAEAVPRTPAIHTAPRPTYGSKSMSRWRRHRRVRHRAIRGLLFCGPGLIGSRSSKPAVLHGMHHENTPSTASSCGTRGSYTFPHPAPNIEPHDTPTVSDVTGTTDDRRITAEGRRPHGRPMQLAWHACIHTNKPMHTWTHINGKTKRRHRKTARAYTHILATPNTNAHSHTWKHSDMNNRNQIPTTQSVA